MSSCFVLEKFINTRVKSKKGKIKLIKKNYY